MALLDTKIDWLASKEDDYTFFAVIDEKRYELRLNDFPQEPLCTVACGSESYDLNKFGKAWTLPRHRREI
jgi:hypothetical protein